MEEGELLPHRTDNINDFKNRKARLMSGFFYFLPNSRELTHVVNLVGKLDS